MSKSIRVSDELAEFAEAAAAESHRSPLQQIEHWAQIERVLEPAPSFPMESAVRPAGRKELNASLDRVGTPEGIERDQEIIRRTTGQIASTDE